MLMAYRPNAELALVEAEELPESEAQLWRRVLTGIRDCELRFEVASELSPEAGSIGGDMTAMCVPRELALVGFEGFPAKSLRVLRCALGVILELGELAFTASKFGVYPRYHAVGDEGDSPTLMSEGASKNIGFGLCMLPSDPRRRR